MKWTSQSGKTKEIYAKKKSHSSDKTDKKEGKAEQIDKDCGLELPS